MCDLCSHRPFEMAKQERCTHIGRLSWCKVRRFRTVSCGGIYCIRLGFRECLFSEWSYRELSIHFKICDLRTWRHSFCTGLYTLQLKIEVRSTGVDGPGQPDLDRAPTHTRTRTRTRTNLSPKSPAPPGPTLGYAGAVA